MIVVGLQHKFTMAPNVGRGGRRQTMFTLKPNIGHGLKVQSILLLLLLLTDSYLKRGCPCIELHNYYGAYKLTLY